MKTANITLELTENLCFDFTIPLPGPQDGPVDPEMILKGMDFETPARRLATEFLCEPLEITYRGKPSEILDTGEIEEEMTGQIERRTDELYNLYAGTENAEGIKVRILAGAIREHAKGEIQKAIEEHGKIDPIPTLDEIVTEVEQLPKFERMGWFKWLMIETMGPLANTGARQLAFRLPQKSENAQVLASELFAHALGSPEADTTAMTAFACAGFAVLGDTRNAVRHALGDVSPDRRREAQRQISDPEDKYRLQA